MKFHSIAAASPARRWSVTVLAFFFCGLATMIAPCDAQDCSASDPSLCDKHERCPVWKSEGECLRSRPYMIKHCPVSCQEEWKQEKETVDDGSCKDRHPDCHKWADDGECGKNPDMSRFCRKSCDMCDNDPCRDLHLNCGAWADMGECESNPGYMETNCQKSCKICQPQATSHPREAFASTASFGVPQIAEGKSYAYTVNRIELSVAYMSTVELDDGVREKCKNKHELCSFWAGIEECRKNEKWMQRNCGPACKSCHLPIEW